jgi:hypothetical protein
MVSQVELGWMLASQFISQEILDDDLTSLGLSFSICKVEVTATTELCFKEQMTLTHVWRGHLKEHKHCPTFSFTWE